MNVTKCCKDSTSELIPLDFRSITLWDGGAAPPGGVAGQGGVRGDQSNCS